MRHNRRLLYVLCIAIAMMLLAVSAQAAEPEAGIPIEEGLINWTDGNVYRVTSDTTLEERVTVSGNVTLEMMEGTTLTCAKGISVPSGKSLTIRGGGTLIADASEEYGTAGIGGNQAQRSSGTITIHSGTITATGGECGAGIGGGNNGDAGTITINGGNVTAISGLTGGAGIGGGAQGNAGTITINGGTVSATGKDTGAGIGSGGGNPRQTSVDGGYAEKIIIRGGKVTATSSLGAGIGAGLKGTAREITLGWSSADDRIDASSIDAEICRMEGNFHYYTADGTDQGEATEENLAEQEGEILLRPYGEATVTLGLTPWNDEWINPEANPTEMMLLQWVNLTAWAPGAEEIVGYAAETESYTEGIEIFHADGTDEEGNARFSWVPNERNLPEGAGAGDSFTRYIYCKARFGDEWTNSNFFPILIHLSDPIAADPEWTAPTAEERTVPQDGLFHLRVVNGDESIYGYGMAIHDGTDTIADSGLMPREEGEYTDIYLPLIHVPTGNQQVSVYAVKFGAPVRHAENLIDLTVTESESTGDLIFCMKDHFEAGERLHILADYRGGEENTFLQVSVADEGDNIWFEDATDDTTYWNEWWTTEQAGEYRITAEAWRWDEESEKTVFLQKAEKLITVTAEHAIEIEDPELPGTITGDGTEGLRFTVNKPGYRGEETGSAKGYNISVWTYDPATDRDITLYEGTDLTAESTTVNIPAEEMPEADPMNPRTISVHLYAYGGRGISSDEKHWEIPLIPPQDARVTLTRIDPESGEVQVNEDVLFRVTTTETEPIRTVCMYDGNDYRDHEGPDPDNQYETNISFDEGEKEYPVFALVTFDEWRDEYEETGVDGRTWIATNVISVRTAAAEGETGDFCFTTDREPDESGEITLTRGEDIQITYAAAEHATHYWIDIERFNEDTGHWEWVGHDADLFPDTPRSEGTAGIAILQTARIRDGGEYRFFANAEGPGYLRKQGYRGTDTKPARMRIREAEEPVWSVRGTDEDHALWTHDPLSISFCAPGSEWTEMTILNAQGDDIWRNGEGGDAVTCSGWTTDCAQEITITAAAHNGEERTEYEYPYTITFRAMEEQLPAPTVTTEKQILSAGEEIRFTFAENPDIFEDGERKEQFAGVTYSAYLWDPWGGMCGDYHDIQPGEEYIFPTEGLEADACYRVSVDIQQPKYNGVATDAPVMILAGSIDPEAEHEVTLEIEPEYTWTRPNTQIPYTITAAGAARTELYDGERWQPETDRPMPDTYTRSRTFRSGDYLILVRAAWETDGQGEPEWVYSNAIEMHVGGEPLPKPGITLTNDAVARGEALEATVTEGDVTGIETEREYNIQIYRKTEEEGMYPERYAEYSFRSGEMTKGALLLRFPTEGLEEGDYFIEINGYTEGYDWNTAQKDFTVTAGTAPAGGVTITAAAESAECGSNVMITASAPGATHLRICETWDEEEWEDRIQNDSENGSLITSYRDSYPNSHKLYAIAWYNGEDPDSTEGTRSAETITITFTAAEGKELAKPSVRYNAMIGAEEDFALEMDAVEHATEYWINIMDENAGPGDSTIYSRSAKEPFNILIPRNRFINGHEYRIHIQATATGYAGSYGDYSVIAAAPETGFTLMVNGSAEPGSIPVNENFSIRAIAPAGATCVAVTHPDGWWNIRKGSRFEENGWNCGEARENVMLLARYTMDEVPEEGTPEWQDYDWSATEWHYSAPVYITFTERGEVPAFTYTLLPADGEGKTAVTEGEFITVKITNIDAVIAGIESQMEEGEVFLRERLGFSARITAKDGRMITREWAQWNGIDEIPVATAGMEETGECILEINGNYGSGWTGRHSEAPVTVRAGGNTAVFRVSKTEVTTSERFTIALNLPGATETAIFEIEGEEEHMADWQDGSAMVRTHDYGSSGTYTLRAKERNAAGEWVTCAGVSDITITVTPAEGQEIRGSADVPVRIDCSGGARIEWDAGTQGSKAVIPDKIDLQICRADNNDVLWHSWHQGDESGFTVPATMPEWTGHENYEPRRAPGEQIFEPGTIYRARVYIQKLGWEADYHEICFAADTTDEDRLMTLPAGLAVIESEAFQGTNANRIAIGEGVIHIENRAFADIGGVLIADFADGNTEIDSGVFDNTTVLILCSPGSSAQGYAENNGIPYRLK